MCDFIGIRQGILFFGSQFLGASGDLKFKVDDSKTFMRIGEPW